MRRFERGVNRGRVCRSTDPRAHLSTYVRQHTCTRSIHPQHSTHGSRESPPGRGPTSLTHRPHPSTRNIAASTSTASVSGLLTHAPHPSTRNIAGMFTMTKWVRMCSHTRVSSGSRPCVARATSTGSTFARKRSARPCDASAAWVTARQKGAWRFGQVGVQSRVYGKRLCAAHPVVRWMDRCYCHTHRGITRKKDKKGTHAPNLRAS